MRIFKGNKISIALACSNFIKLFQRTWLHSTTLPPLVLFIFISCVCCFALFIFVHYMCAAACRGQRALGPLALEVQAFMSSPVLLLGIEPESSARPASGLHP